MKQIETMKLVVTVVYSCYCKCCQTIVLLLWNNNQNWPKGYIPNATMSCDGLAGSVGGSSLLVFVRSLVHVLSWCPMSMCFPLFPHVSPLSWSFTERHRSVCQCLSLFPATERLGCVSRPDQLKDIREQLQALSSVDVLETWGSWGQRWTMLPHIGTRRHGHRLLGLWLCWGLGS